MSEKDILQFVRIRMDIEDIMPREINQTEKPNSIEYNFFMNSQKI